MSNTDGLSLAADLPVRGGGVKLYGALGGGEKPSLSPADAAERIAGGSWSYTLRTPTSVSYAFRASGEVPENDSGGFTQFNAVQVAAAERSLQSWSEVANISFTRVNPSGYSNDATILFANYDHGPAAGFTFLPGHRVAGSDSGDVWLNASLAYNMAPTVGNYGGSVFIHEIGHAIGLLHPSEYDVGDDATYADSADYYEDSGQYTVMSYFDPEETGARVTGYASAPLVDDIWAAQMLYGANMSTRTGDTIYGFNTNAGDLFSASSPNSRLIFSIWDAGGNDTIDLSGYLNRQKVDLREGAFSDIGLMTGNVSIAYGAVVENAVGGSAGDVITGNQVANALTGNGGDDSLYGEAGNDRLFGGSGNDLMDGGSGGDTIDGGDGNDRIESAGGFSAAADYLAGGTGSDTISGGDGHDHIYGNAISGASGTADGGDRLFGGGGHDYLQGNAGNDELNGGVGNDRLYGGADNDTSRGNEGRDLLQGGKGNDTVDGGEDNDTVRGGADDDYLLGGVGDDELAGGNGQDTLVGGSGADRLTGALGDDRFVFGGGEVGIDPWATDHILDFGQGTDRIQLGFAVGQVLYGNADSTSAAFDLAAGLLRNDPGGQEVAAIGVGADTFLYFRQGGGDAAPDGLIVAEGVPNAGFDLADFA
jgi:serralysin